MRNQAGSRPPQGYGESSRPAALSAYNLYRVTFELDTVVSCLGYKQVIPVGHDWGGNIAWMYGMLMPARTKAVVVLSTPHPYPFFSAHGRPWWWAGEARAPRVMLPCFEGDALRSLLPWSAACV